MGRGGFRQRAGLRVPRCAARGARAARGGRAARLVRDAGPDGGGERAHLRGPPPPSEAQQAARGRALRLPRLTPRAAPAMITTRYTQWDGTQKLKLDADKVFEKLAEYMSYTDDVRQAMDWMLRQGMDFDGVQVMGLEEFIEQLRQEMRQRYRDFNLKNALSEMEQKLQDILDRERSTLDSLKGQKPGIEEKQRELSRLPRRLSEAIRKLESYDFEDAQARADFEELLGEYENIRDLENFRDRNQHMFHGPKSLGYQEALELMREMERMRQLEQDLMAGNFDTISLEELRELLGQQAMRDFQNLKQVMVLLA